jgi:hypothetical protein
MSMNQAESAFREALEKLGIAQPPDPTVVDETLAKDREGGTTHVPDPGGVTVSNIWRHPDAHPIVLDLLLIRKYGPEWLMFEPETLQSAVPQDFGTQTLSDLNLSKLMACRALHAVETFWRQWEIFTWCSMPLNGEFPDFEVMQVPTVAQAMVAVDCANRIRTDVGWSDEMKTYLSILCQHEGLLVPIEPLDFVKVEGDFGVDLSAVRSRWPEVRARGALMGETPEDEQLRRMLTARDFLEESRTRLRAQLLLVQHE